MILLLDRMSREAELLRQSLLAAGENFRAFCFEDDGFLPAGVESPYHYYSEAEDVSRDPILRECTTGMDKSDDVGDAGCPLYFSRLPVPDGWEIRGNGSGGDVWDYETKRADITYASPAGHRMVKSVTWLDDKGTACWTDHYDRYGRLFARTARDWKGQEILRTYYRYEKGELTGKTPKAIPSIVENRKDYSITLRQMRDGREEEHIFSGKAEFMTYYLQEIGADFDRILFHSLSWSFLTERALRERNPGKNQDVLFWQEDIKEKLPGNMTVILREKRWVSHIAVQSEEVYGRILQQLREHAAEYGLQGTEEERKMFRPLGYIYPIKRENNRQKKVLILTNSDAVEKLQELVEALPDFIFHVAALTEMSQKLMRMEMWDNVALHHGISEMRAKELLENCDFYLDINHGNEIVDAVREAYLHRALILGFYETAHNRRFEPAENLWPAADWRLLAKRLKETALSASRMEAMLKRQDACAMRAGAEEYRAFLKCD